MFVTNVRLYLSHSGIHQALMIKVVCIINPSLGMFLNKLAKLGDAIAISKSETITDSLTH